MFDAELMFPGSVQALLDQVRSQVDRLNNDIQASELTKEGSFRDNWHSFVDEFFAFYNRLTGSWIERAETANIDTLKDYANRQLPAWQLAFQQLGGSVTGAGVTPRETPASGFSLTGLSWEVVKPVLLIGGALALVAYLLTRSGVGVKAGVIRLGK